MPDNKFTDSDLGTLTLTGFDEIYVFEDVKLGNAQNVMVDIPDKDWLAIAHGKTLTVLEVSGITRVDWLPSVAAVNDGVSP
ncbi:hypothetical protein [uncultured Paracoccus sp.]|uniref:hypothetical protein n=1 Tax=uncultured Paracoccus sp. TaxID=189685 RepID=UPI0025F09282|nr:hypothetical protein [uncultured Paracoccus sp.]